MKFRLNPLALAAAIAVATLPGIAAAFDECPADHVADGYECTTLKGEGKNGGHYRITFPSDWDGDLVVVNHGFDLNPLHIRPHETCGYSSSTSCENDSDCTGAAPDKTYQNFCNNISFLGIDQVLLPMGKAVAASTYSQTGWAVFGSAKDIKDMITVVKKDDTYGPLFKRVIVTGFSLGGAVTGDAILKLKIDGAVPLCAAVGGGLPTWDVAQDVRLVYDFLCDDAPQSDVFPYPPKFAPAPDLGVETTANSGLDAQDVGVKVNNCFGMLFPATDPELLAGQQQRLADFIALTNFTGYQGEDGGTNVASAIGFATIGLGDFVRDPERLKGKRIGLNDELDYSVIGDDGALAIAFDGPRACSLNQDRLCTIDTDCEEGEGTCEGGVKRLTKGPGRSKLKKASWPDFTKGKGAKVTYPIVSMAGAADWLVIPEFQRVFTTALADGGKNYTQTWINTFGHCVFTEEEVTATFNKFFEWMGTAGGSYGEQPTKEEIHAECLTLGPAENCNFNDAFAPDALQNRIPARADWPPAAAHL
jgi:hypothetical protein